MKLSVPPVPDDVLVKLAPLLEVGVTTDAAAEHLQTSKTDAWHYLDNLRLAGSAGFRPCGAEVLWCCPEDAPDHPVQQKGQHR
jgi:hypothetical protein